ncbi:MAG: PEP-CTERM sorting domain-containing protein [Planctomycetota bacterium]|nr:PEP-CTERM sorting domain-containing protein [Planctomycetota bacterium]
MVRPRSFAWILVSLLSLILAAPLQADITPGGDVDPADYSWWHNGGDCWTDAYIGMTAAGSVTVNLGSDLSSYCGFIGYVPDATGGVTVAGSGSTWTCCGSGCYSGLHVGLYGYGTLNITGGGAVSNSTNGYIGYFPGSTGVVTVAGGGSTWTSSDYLYVGNYGQGMLNITGGGAVSNDYGCIGYEAGSAGLVTVAGSSTTWTNSSNIFVGIYGQGTLNITDGGAVSNSGGDIGYYTGSTGVVTVAGGGSTWTNSSNIFVGISGQGTLNITGGGSVSNVSGCIGYEAGSAGLVTVAGSGSTWNNSSNIFVGTYGQGKLNITDGGVVSNYSYGYIGRYSGSTGVVTVEGGGSNWTNNIYLYVGNYGQGTLNITNGGAVSNTYGYIGNSSGSTGNVTVAGGGSAWTCGGSLYIGGSNTDSGGTGELTIGNGGIVEVGETLKVWGGGTLNIGAAGQATVGDALVLEQDATLTAETGATIHMTGSAFENNSTNPENLAGLGNLTLIFEGGSGGIDPLEVAGTDMGADVAGLTNNFALKRLIVGGDDNLYLLLRDLYDNMDDGADNEVLYTNFLTVNTGSWLLLGGKNLYYYKGQIDGTVLEEGGSLTQIEWIKGDANWDIKVDGSDLNQLLTGWGTGTEWDEGDFNDDDAVDGSDLNWLLTNWTYPPASSSVPEPASAMLLLLGMIAVLRRRKK